MNGKAFVFALAVSGATAFCSVSASSMDGAPLASSKRVLVFHLTDVLNSGAEFKSAGRTEMTNWGALPYLAAAGEGANAPTMMYELAAK